MRNKEVISYLGLWESMNNKNFKGGEFATFKNEAGSNKFKMSPQKWVKKKLMQLELFQNLGDMMVEHLHILI